jgi:large subunit ribosomal protein L17
MSTSLFAKERIRTTLQKAKELRPFAEKLITLSKKESLHARRQVLRHVQDKAVVSKLFESISARYAQRPGGYTRIIKLGPRRGDSAEMAIIELVGAEVREVAEPEPAGKEKKAAKKVTAKKTPKKKTAKKKASAAKKTAKKKAAAGKKTAKKKAAKKKAAAGKKTAKKKAAAGKKTARKKTASKSSGKD